MHCMMQSAMVADIYARTEPVYRDDQFSHSCSNPYKTYISVLLKGCRCNFDVTLCVMKALVIYLIMSLFTVHAGSSCLLRAEDLTTDTAMQVQGSDGKHPYVQSSVNVKVKPYTNDTLDAAVVTRVIGLSAEKFVSSAYNKLLQAISSVAASGQQARLISLQQTGDYLDLYLVLQRGDGTYSPSLRSLITNNRASIQRQAGITISTPARNVCNSSSCSGRGECLSQVSVTDQLDYTSTDELTLTYYTPHLSPVCNCIQEYMGDRCEEEAGACMSAPCQNNARCVRVGETGFECECTPQWTGNLCAQDVNECEAGTVVCENGGT